ncbi:helix-turn-helix domain-containing protein [Gordonia sp. SID5947]|uniref:helix-turn-helix domain-containing protein n=1 Tax=Gordonia sp. SID5947 TaxID=2690315 RepID=UPI00136CD0A8|nr:AraC family transcriptional regulator [Gordonia sp. SID5947]MYR05563.1 helix-turn-helix domain-containing protein [Gordonia sp. SID5947]
MVLLLDTDTVDAGAVIAELHNAFRVAGTAPGLTITPLTPHRVFRARVSGWTVGDGTSLMHFEADPIALAVTNSRLRACPVDRVAVVAVSPGSWSHRQHGVVATVDSRVATLLIVDQAAPYDFRRVDRGESTVVHVDTGLLNLPPSAIRKAVQRLRPSSHLYQLYLSFLGELREVAETNPEVLSELNSTTILLTHALILDAAADAPGEPSSASADIMHRVRSYIERNITDPELSAASIALAHNISVRTLYKAWQGTDPGLHDYIIGRRLELARDALLDRSQLTVAAVARAHGFTDPTHFAHRFRDRYQVSPRDWRRINS